VIRENYSLREDLVQKSTGLFKAGTKSKLIALLVSTSFALTACGGGGSPATSAPPPVVAPPPPPVVQVSPAFRTETSTSRFLNKATFGTTHGEIQSLADTEVSDWIISEFNKPASLYLADILALIEATPEGDFFPPRRVSDLYLDAAIAGDDQLRQRMVLALSEIVVVSHESDLDNYPDALAHYVDILSTNAFGNYRDLIGEITYSPAMAVYLTYLRNRKGNIESGRVPDENYARELLQLFTLGLVELNLDGTPKLDGQGNPIEIFDNTDITGLAKVFTGLSTEGSDFWRIRQDPTSTHKPLVVFPQHHSELEKSFLGTTIPAGTTGEESIETALDTIFAHPNVAPFLSRQLIQRFVTSNPTPAYVRRVATSFENGQFALPDGRSVGTGVRGDLGATIAAVLLDDEALQDRATAPPEFGKIREPIVRFINWARVFGETTPDSYEEWSLGNGQAIGQMPFASPSVFNFFRPGYVAPGAATGAAGLNAPELQIINESSAIGYINFINAFIYDFSGTRSDDPDAGVNADYSNLVPLADEPQDLVDRIDLVLTGNSLSSDTKTRMVNLLNEIPISTEAADEDRLSRILLSVTMAMTAPGYTVQR